MCACVRILESYSILENNPIDVVRNKLPEIDGLIFFIYAIYQYYVDLS